jgi:hypothetical protein
MCMSSAGSFHCKTHLPDALSRARSHPRLFLSYSTWRRRCSRQYVCLHPRPPTPSRIPLVANVRPRRVLLHLKDALQLCAHALPTPIRITTLHRHATLHVPARARLSLFAVALFPAMSTARELSNAKDRPKCAVAKKSKRTSPCQLPTSKPPQRLNMRVCSPCAREEHMSRQPGCALSRPRSATIPSPPSSSAWPGRL